MIQCCVVYKNVQKIVKIPPRKKYITAKHFWGLQDLLNLVSIHSVSKRCSVVTIIFCVVTGLELVHVLFCYGRYQNEIVSHRCLISSDEYATLAMLLAFGTATNETIPFLVSENSMV